MNRILKIGLVSISDRASSGVYQDQGIPALNAWLNAALSSPFEVVERLIADVQPVIEATLIDLCDSKRCDLILTTGGTGPARRDVTPEATLAIATKVMPGFGEQMRQISLTFVPTAILSRQVAVIREVAQGIEDSAPFAESHADLTIDSHAALIINLPGQPKAIAETLGGLKHEDGSQRVAGIFAAVPYCIDLIGGPYIETQASICAAFRPKNAVKPR